MAKHATVRPAELTDKDLESANSNLKEARWMARIESLANSKVEGNEMEATLVHKGGQRDEGGDAQESIFVHASRRH